MAAKTISNSVKACQHYAQIFQLDDRSYLLSCGRDGADGRVAWLGTAIRGFALSTEQGAAVKPVAAREVSERSRKTAGCARRSGSIVCFSDRGAGLCAVSGGYGPRLDPCHAICAWRATSDGTCVHAFSAFVEASPSFGLISSASMARSGQRLQRSERPCRQMLAPVGKWRCVWWTTLHEPAGHPGPDSSSPFARQDKRNATLMAVLCPMASGVRCSTFSIKTIAMDARSNR